jgi:hypothetical protein
MVTQGYTNVLPIPIIIIQTSMVAMKPKKFHQVKQENYIDVLIYQENKDMFAHFHQSILDMGHWTHDLLDAHY